MLEREDFVCGRALRLDALVAAETELSRTQAQRLIRDGLITLNGEIVKPNAVTSIGDRVEIAYPEPEEVDVLPEDIPLDVLYEDEDLLVVNKPRSLRDANEKLFTAWFPQCCAPTLVATLTNAPPGAAAAYPCGPSVPNSSTGPTMSSKLVGSCLSFQAWKSLRPANSASPTTPDQQKRVPR